MFLTFEFDDGALEVNLDDEGRQRLIAVLQALGPGDHEHLATADWGGGTLEGKFPNPDLTPIRQVTIQMRLPDDLRK